MNFRLIDELETKAIPVFQSCRVLGMSCSGFYEAKRRAAASAVCAATFMCVLHSLLVSKAMAVADGHSIVKSGVIVGRFYVGRLMRQANLKPVWKRKIYSYHRQ